MSLTHSVTSGLAGWGLARGGWGSLQASWHAGGNLEGSLKRCLPRTCQSNESDIRATDIKKCLVSAVALYELALCQAWP